MHKYTYTLLDIVQLQYFDNCHNNMHTSIYFAQHQDYLPTLMRYPTAFALALRTVELRSESPESNAVSSFPTKKRSTH